MLIFSTTEARAKPRNAELLSPQPSSHDKSMVSPEEHREPSPVLCPLCFLNRISDKATTAFFNYVDVNYAGRVVFLLGFCSLEKNEEE